MRCEMNQKKYKIRRKKIKNLYINVMIAFTLYCEEQTKERAQSDKPRSCRVDRHRR